MSISAIDQRLRLELEAADRLFKMHAITNEERKRVYRQAYNDARRELGLPPLPPDWEPPLPPDKIVIVDQSAVASIVDIFRRRRKQWVEIAEQ